MAIEAIKKKYPILDENGQSATYPTFASQVFDGNGVPIEQRAIPNGGTAGQVLTKASETDYDTEWVDPPEGDVKTVDGEFPDSNGNVQLDAYNKDNLIFDDAPVEGSTNPITSGAVYTALGNSQSSTPESVAPASYTLGSGVSLYSEDAGMFHKAGQSGFYSLMFRIGSTINNTVLVLSLTPPEGFVLAACPKGTMIRGSNGVINNLNVNIVDGALTFTGGGSVKAADYTYITVPLLYY